jgi:hypothetical protein
VLAWPATDGQHGVLASPFALGPAAGRTALETLHSQWEPLQKDGPDPKHANGYGRSIPSDIASVCRDIVLPASLTFDNIIRSDGFGPLSVQNRTFVCYTAGAKDGFFRHIVNGALPPRKSGELHAARDPLRLGGLDRYAGIEAPERLHCRDVWLFNLTSERCPRGNTRILPGRTISS